MCDLPKQRHILFVVAVFTWVSFAHWGTSLLIVPFFYYYCSLTMVLSILLLVVLAKIRAVTCEYFRSWIWPCIYGTVQTNKMLMGLLIGSHVLLTNVLQPVKSSMVNFIWTWFAVSQKHLKTIFAALNDTLVSFRNFGSHHRPFLNCLLSATRTVKYLKSAPTHHELCNLNFGQLRYRRSSLFGT